MKHRPYYFFPLLILSLACIIVSCSNPRTQATLDRAEAVMESHPDSALLLLSSIDKQELSGKRQKAHYALLMSMALDKNYIDTTTFDVLQPAIDYYLENGTPNEKLHTYYYQGRIFQNQGDLDNALSAFTRGIDKANNASDSLCLARMHVSRASLYYDFYDFEEFLNSQLKAASIYSGLSRNDLKFDCLLNAFNGAIILEDTVKADSLYILCNQLHSNDTCLIRLKSECNLSYISTFKSTPIIRVY